MRSTPTRISRYVSEAIVFAWSKAPEGVRTGLTNVLIDLGDRAMDRTIVWREQFLVALADETRLESHGLARGMPRFAAEAVETYRLRLLSAWAWWYYGGTATGVERVFLAAFGLTATVEKCRNKRRIHGDGSRYGNDIASHGGLGPWASWDLVLEGDAFDASKVALYRSLAGSMTPACAHLRYIIHQLDPVVEHGDGSEHGGGWYYGSRRYYL